MTHSMKMGLRTVPVLLIAFAMAAQAQTSDEDFSIYKDHPRLLLTPQRLKLLRREKERNSARWQQFDTLIRGKAQMPEPGFAFALYYQVAKDEDRGKQAVQWALTTGTDIRQLALVYDWCQPLLSSADSAALRKKISAGLRIDWQTASLPAARAYAFAVIAMDELPDAPKYLNQLVNTWWRNRFAPGIKAGSQAPLDAQLYPVYELLHVIRDNTGVDLRENAPRYFKDLPAMELLSYYPATYPAPENDFRIPAFAGKKEPDLQAATFSRIAELSMVAYDNVATDSQFLQGWVLHDRFILHSALGAPYEFFWANPYQPGLSFYHLPLSIHDPQGGRLFLRSTWDEDATWLGYFDGELQVFDAGKIRQIPIQAQQKIITVGSDAVLPAKGSNMRFSVPAEGPATVYVIGLKPRRTYSIEIDDEELDEQPTDPAGTLALKSTRKDQRTIRIR
jgi:hypothetical protein